MLQQPRRNPRFRLAVLASLLLGCTSTDSIVDADNQDLRIQSARPTATVYTAQEVGALPGDLRAVANGVNDSAWVAGTSEAALTGVSRFRPFVKIAGTFVQLGTAGTAEALSAVYPLYVVGSDATGGTSFPARWRIDSAGAAPLEEVLGSSLGKAVSVNDAGVAIGDSANRAVVWATNGTREFIQPTGSYDRTSGRAINNASHILVGFYDDQGDDRAFLRVGATWIELAPATGYPSSYAYDISNSVGGIVYASGVSADGVTNTDYHQTRWKVDVVNNVVVTTEKKKEISEGFGVSNDGSLGGQAEKNSTSTGYFWTLTEVLPLKPPHGGTNPRINDVSPNGIYIVGDAAFKLQFHGVIWTHQ